MKNLELFLEVMRTANLLSPTILAVAASIKAGREAGKDDEAVKAESLAIANATATEADRQLAIQPQV